MHTIIENMNREDLMALAKPDRELQEILAKTPYVEMLTMDTDIVAHRAQILGFKLAYRAALPPVLNPGWVEQDRRIRVRDGHEITIRVHRPRTPPSGGSPVFVVYHGGGFVIGDLDSEVDLCRQWTELGGVAVNVEYRLAPEWKWPVGVEDAFDALKWTASHVDELGVNPSKGFLLGGISAGGNLTAVLSHLYHDAGLSPPLTGCYCSVPSTCAAEALPERWKGMFVSHEQNANSPVLNRGNLAVFSKFYAADPSSPLRSPLLYPSHENLPPTYLQVCGMDPLRDEGLIYERVLREAGVKTKMDVYVGLPHWFWGAWPQAEFTKKFKTDCRAGLEWLLDMSGEKGKVGRVWRDEVEKVGVSMNTHQDKEL